MAGAAARTGRVVSLWRHPLKGFTPEPVERADLEAGGRFPHDRVFAVENGPSGFDPSAPAFVSKQKFTVLAAIPGVARVRTAFEGETGRLQAAFPGRAGFAGDLGAEPGRRGFEAWLADCLGEDARGPLRVVSAPGHRFTDHPEGRVSVINLESVRDLGRRMGRELDPLRFRANVYVEGWEPWSELSDAAVRLELGGARFERFKPIVRCLATHVDPEAGVADADVSGAIFDAFGHAFCGIYVHVTQGGRVTSGDAAVLG